MTSSVTYLNGVYTLVENGLNIVGYLPKEKFPNLNDTSTRLRIGLGIVQITTGIALIGFGTLNDVFRNSQPTKYLTLFQQAVSLGILHLNHGLLNIVRAFFEKKNLGAYLTAYDFYGRKFLPSLALPFDLQEKCYHYVRSQLDRVHFITFIPPKISVRL